MACASETAIPRSYTNVRHFANLRNELRLSANFVVQASRLHPYIHNVVCSRDGRTTSLPKPGGESELHSQVGMDPVVASGGRIFLVGDPLLAESGGYNCQHPSSPFDRSRGVWDLGFIFLPPVLLTPNT